jgi:hypothetical protein
VTDPDGLGGARIGPIEKIFVHTLADHRPWRLPHVALPSFLTADWPATQDPGPSPSTANRRVPKNIHQADLSPIEQQAVGEPTVAT